MLVIEIPSSITMGSCPLNCFATAVSSALDSFSAFAVGAERIKAIAITMAERTILNGFIVKQVFLEMRILVPGRHKGYAERIYLGRRKTVESSVIWASDMPSGTKPMAMASRNMMALLLRVSTMSKASIMSGPTAKTPCFSHITTS